jgi:mevalonate kinase
MKNRHEVFYSKILLFGEYSVICGSEALTIPYTHFQGELSFLLNNKYTDLNFAKESNMHLQDFANHIKKLLHNDELDFDINIKALERDIADGMYFESSIPQGYGVGSSGALVAAIYRHYVPDNHSKRTLLESEGINIIKNRLAKLESYFHGTSSGLDPLNSYLKQPVLIKEKKHIELVEIPQKDFSDTEAIFLINSGTAGITEPLVNYFMESCENENYKNVIMNEYIPLNNKCIENILVGDSTSFFRHLKELSKYQIEHFNPMIPDSIQALWKQGLETDNFTLKLCGSGGGGFILGFTKDFPSLKKQFDTEGINAIPVYQRT